jgi:alpha-L-fucosidase 2
MKPMEGFAQHRMESGTPRNLSTRSAFSTDHISTMILRVLVCLLAGVVQAAFPSAPPLPVNHGLQSGHLARTWDEGIPLGNGMLGALIWQKAGRLRISLDRADLWDLRPMKGLDRNEFRYRWVESQVRRRAYGIVQEYFDAPYEAEPAPSKIPGAALEIDFPPSDSVISVRLDIARAVCTIDWSNGGRLTTFIHATEPVGWYRWEKMRGQVRVSLVPPNYGGRDSVGGGGSVRGEDVRRLGYAPGVVRQSPRGITYLQAGWGGFEYEVNTTWDTVGPGVVGGAWSISSGGVAGSARGVAETNTLRALQRGFSRDLDDHERWWKAFWEQSSIEIPDSILERQWFLEQYKLGSASRTGAPPISLQAIWTADNDRLPPWKGDFHHDLNTELSYWSCYSANHLAEGLPLLDHLQNNIATYRRYTRRYFETEGLAVPGVTTLDGSPMGGWIQYACSPTISAWLSQHFYLQWRYTMDTSFLRQSAYPWMKETAIFLELLTRRSDGMCMLPMSSSPEIHDNDISAWFTGTTNYDLALMRFAFGRAAELADVLGLAREAERWRADLAGCPDFAFDKDMGLMIAPGLPYIESHRHFSHSMAIHPLGLIRWEDGKGARRIIRATIARLDSIGPSGWCGYSYAWLANLKARAKDGAGAARALRIFASAFCSSNSFHVNGDQTKSGYSAMTYRPFTLEGNFAFAGGVQEMLLQSYSGMIEVFPAVPPEWSDVAFTTLRAEGAYLVSARRIKGATEEITITSDHSGMARLENPFSSWHIASSSNTDVRALGRVMEIHFRGRGGLTVRRGLKPDAE